MTSGRRIDGVRYAAVWFGCTLLHIAGGVFVSIALLSLGALCQDGDFERCMGGKPSFELWFQCLLAVVGLAGTLGVRRLVARGRNRPAPAALAAVVLLWAAWAVFLDAATHGWDGLQLFWIG